MKYLRYYSEFYDRENVLYRVEILQEAEKAFTPQEVTFAGDGVTIEWPEVKKIDPLASSGATLRLVSMTDRQFVDLYSVEACAIRMDIYRAGALYWSGTLDTELFEEPYSQADKYVTEVTFSDFGVLDRLYWEQTGIASIKSIIDTCLSATQINYTGIEENISTTIPNVQGNLLENCALTLANFYDEDGEAWPIKQVLEEVLRPFALQMRQKDGKIHIYDLNSLSVKTPQEVVWRGTNSQLGVEPIYNKVDLTYSPYSDTDLLDGKFNKEKILPNPNTSGVTTLFIPLPETDFVGFNFYYGLPLTTLTEIQGLYINDNARLFRTEPVNNGEETAGVMWGVRLEDGTWRGQMPIQLGYVGPDCYLYGKIIQTPPIPISTGITSNQIKISLEVMLDPRINPYESDGWDNEEEDWDNFKHKANHGAIPCKLVLETADGEIWSYDNYSLWEFFGLNDKYPPYRFMEYYNKNKGRWVLGDSGNLFLSYYNESDRKSDTGFGGWQTNKQSIGYWAESIPRSISLNITGEDIPMPPKSGVIKLLVYSGVSVVDNGAASAGNIQLHTETRWMLYRNLRISISSYTGGEVKAEDIIYSAWLNKNAKDDIPIDTYIGTSEKYSSMARGAIIRSGDYSTIDAFSRAEITDKIEKLLIGTIYSNYASRHNTLSGTIKLIPQNVVLSDKSSVNSRYIALSLTENLGQATSDVKMAEFEKDSYEGIEYE